MRAAGETLRVQKSGQLLVVAALAIAITISSTTLYVYELGKEETGGEYSSLANFVLALKLGTRNALISSLANISNGGDRVVLTQNLALVSQVFEELHQFGTCELLFNPLNQSNYLGGALLSWNSSDSGISSAYSQFVLNIHGLSVNASTAYSVNVTTSTILTGSYSLLSGGEELVNLTCSIYNEGEPALARNLTFFYQDAGVWIMPSESSNLQITDLGSGVYLVSFVASASSDPLVVSVHAIDSRGIFVQANTTCYAA